MDLTRRQVLRRGGLAVGVALAGCASDGARTDTPTPTRGDGGTAAEATSTPTATDAPPPTPERTPGTEEPQESGGETPTTTTQPGVAWRFDLGAAVDAAPTTADGTLYVGGHRETGGTPTPGGDPGGPATSLRGIGLASGRERVRVDVGAPVQASPHVVGDRVYVVRGYDGIHGRDYQLRAVSTDSRALWRHQARSLTFLAVLGADGAGVVFGERDDNLGEGTEETVALAPDGSVRWRRETADVVDGTVDAETAYVADYRRRVRAFDRASGDERWTVEREAMVRRPTVTDGGLVAAGSVVFALDRATGDVRWTFEESTPQWLYVDDGRAFVPTEDGRLVALDAGDGSEVWTVERGGGNPFAIGYEAVYVGRDGGRLAAIDRATGDDLWTAEVGESDGFHPTDRSLYLRRAGEAVALDPADGRRIGSVSVAGDPRWVVAGDARDAILTPGGLVYGLAF